MVGAADGSADVDGESMVFGGSDALGFALLFGVGQSGSRFVLPPHWFQ